jgi:23S rRNA (cytidine1920-2'-O)/16S rRNA (cytidine1409-2'-O)-methyltransferase
MPARQRLDEALVARGLCPSRSRARDAVLRGAVTVDGEQASKPSRMVGADNAIAISYAAGTYVSRAALKLKHALRHFGISALGKYCLDVGASTGGFTQVLLEEGARHVTAIDVGHGQMKLQDPRITLIEGLNARDLCAEHIQGPVELIVCDVSFISLKLALPKALELAEEGTALVALIKPQFEAGREAVGKGGVVSDPQEHERVCREIVAFLCGQGWRVLGVTGSPVVGGDGNREFLVAAVKSPV